MASQAISETKVVVAVDPGRDKCGLAAVDGSFRVLHREVAPTPVIGQAVARLLELHPGATLVMGDRTAAKEVGAVLARATGIAPVLVDEHESTTQGRRRYFQSNPPRGWRRLVPVSLQTPPRPFDDYVAVVIAERYLASLPPVGREPRGRSPGSSG